ncbi:MAG: ribonuclease H family protein [Selenomonadaceae bacterium]
MTPKKNFYAVKQGRNRGIFYSWLECKKQVQGFPGALFKGFITLDEAELYLGEKKSTIEIEKVFINEPIYNIYVDGSYFNGKYSWGFAVFDADKVIFTQNGIGESTDAAKLHNVAGEIEAVIQAVKWAQQERLTHIVIFHDYSGLSEWAEGRWKTNTRITQEYAAFMKNCIGWVTCKKVSGHTGVEGNELADKLAKNALGL